MTITIEQAAMVMSRKDYPDLWADDPAVAHRAASPLAVSEVRKANFEMNRSRAQALSDAGLLATYDEVRDDKIDGLTEDLYQAVLVAYRRGAHEWAWLNYPQWRDALAAGREVCPLPSPPEEGR